MYINILHPQHRHTQMCKCNIQIYKHLTLYTHINALNPTDRLGGDWNVTPYFMHDGLSRFVKV